MTREEQIARVERDRKRRENALLLILLALSRRARRYVNRAMFVGGDWRLVLAAVLLGDEALDLPGGVLLLAALMADSHLAGVRRVGLLTGLETAAAETREELIRRHEPRAREALERIRRTLEAAIASALDQAAPADRISADVKAVAEAFRVAGFAPEKPRGAEAEATAAVTSAYAAGMGEGYGVERVTEAVQLVTFVNPLDKRTTDICRPRHGVTLPLGHPWWRRNWPPLHWGPCRSIVLPAARNAKVTENPPESPPPDVGWGQWAGVMGPYMQI